MDKKIERFTYNKGKEIEDSVLESYRDKYPEPSPEVARAMGYASGYTAYMLGHEFYSSWIVPLQRQAKLATVSALASLVLLLGAIFYTWSNFSYDSFIKFVVAFAPAVAGLIFTAAKSYKSWAEAKKALAEAQALSSSNSEIIG